MESDFTYSLSRYLNSIEAKKSIDRSSDAITLTCNKKTMVWETIFF